MISTRQKRFLNLIRLANEQPTQWLIDNVSNYRSNHDISRLSILACLRIISSRTDTTGRPYRERMQKAKKLISAIN